MQIISKLKEKNYTEEGKTQRCYFSICVNGKCEKPVGENVDYLLVGCFGKKWNIKNN